MGVLEPKVMRVHHTYGYFGDSQSIENSQLENQSARGSSEWLIDRLTEWSTSPWLAQLEKATILWDIAYFLEMVISNNPYSLVQNEKLMTKIKL